MMTDKKEQIEDPKATKSGSDEGSSDPSGTKMKKEIGGRTGPEPTRYGDWEKNGIISDF